VSLFLGCCPSTSPSLVLVLAASYGEKQLWRGLLSRCAHSGAGHAAWFDAFGLHVLGLEKTCMLVSGYGEEDSVLAHGETRMEFLALPGQRVSAAKPWGAEYLHGIFFSVSWLRDVVLPAYPVSRIFPILERKTQLIRCCPCFLDLLGSWYLISKRST
jgi:hypothetical protein